MQLLRLLEYFVGDDGRLRVRVQAIDLKGSPELQLVDYSFRIEYLTTPDYTHVDSFGRHSKMFF